MSDSKRDIREQQADSEHDQVTCVDPSCQQRPHLLPVDERFGEEPSLVREAIRQTFMAEAGIRDAVREALRESDAALYATSAGRSVADPFDIPREVY